MISNNQIIQYYDDTIAFITVVKFTENLQKIGDDKTTVSHNSKCQWSEYENL